MLELGCGAGANIPLFRTLQFDYFAIEGSATIVKRLVSRYPNLVNKIHIGDFSSKFPFEDKFDLILDRASITHNSTESIKNTLQLAFDSLKSKGVFIGSDWFSQNHTAYMSGQISEDEFTKCDYKEGQFVRVGKVHFSDEAHIRSLFSKFAIIFLEEKLVKQYQPDDAHQFASWNIVAMKP